MAAELHTICERLEKAPATLVISGAGGVFAAGADIEDLRSRRSPEALAGINSFLFRRIQRLPMPVIAAVDGWALGGGAELAYAADFRIGTTNARFGNPEVGLGIAAAAGGSWRLPALVGEPIAKQILLAGRILDAPEALAVGLVTEVVEPDELLTSAMRLAAQIAKGAPAAVRLTKALMHVPESAHPVIDNMAQAVLFESAEKYDRMTAFLEERRGINS
jgi:enoyl-CoA hydratase